MKRAPPTRRLLLRHQGEPPIWQPPRPECPICGSDNTIPIIYGYPAPDSMDRMLAAAKRGEIELGGCLITDNDPTDHCKNCGQYFGYLKMKN